MHQELATLQYWSQRMKMCNNLEGKDSVFLDYNCMSLGNHFPTFCRNCVPSKYQQSVTAQENKILNHTTVKISEFMPTRSC
jgi:hypothetical protein